MKHQFKSRKDASKYLAEKGIDTSSWSEEKWLSLNQGQAEIHMMALAEAIWDAYNESTPKQLKAGEWHIPFGDQLGERFADFVQDCLSEGGNDDEEIINRQIKIATARCARVSYTVVGEEGKEHSYEKDIELHDKLLASGHMSPFEHCAKAMDDSLSYGNFRGFMQYRQIVEQ